MSSLVESNSRAILLMMFSSSFIRDHPYVLRQHIGLVGWVGGWVQKMANFADIQYYIYADIVNGSKKVPKNMDGSLGATS